MRAALALFVVWCLALAGPGAAGFYEPPPADDYAAWTPDGRTLLYRAGTDAYWLHAVSADGTGDRRVTPLDRFSRRFAVSADGSRVAWVGFDGQYRLFVLAEGRRRDLGPALEHGRPAWAPDGRRLALSVDGGLAVVDIASGSTSVVAAGWFSEPAWSPAADAVAARTGDAVVVVDVAAGSTVEILRAAPGTLGPPAWSPDGRRIAVLAGERVVLARPDGSGGDVLPLRRADAVETLEPHLVWTPDGRSLLYATNGGSGFYPTFGVYRLDLDTGAAARLLSLGSSRVLVHSVGRYLAVSPDGERAAFQHGGECRDRVGIHVVRIDGSGLRRVSNSCRILGTDGPDRLSGTPLADVLAGLAGDDRLVAHDPGNMGDTLEGGPGDDVLVGGFRQDTLEGGSGRDRLLGGASGDLLVGGPGRDVIAAHGGLDRVDSRDGEQDTVSCGTNGPTTKPERDVVDADRRDVVARDCEVVRRR